MTVRELCELLQRHPDQAEVVLISGGGRFHELTKVLPDKPGDQATRIALDWGNGQ